MLRVVGRSSRTLGLCVWAILQTAAWSQPASEVPGATQVPDATFVHKSPKYSLKIPPGWKQIPVEVVREKLPGLVQDPGNPIRTPVAVFQKDSGEWFSFPMVVLDHQGPSEEEFKANMDKIVDATIARSKQAQERRTNPSPQPEPEFENPLLTRSLVLPSANEDIHCGMDYWFTFPKSVRLTSFTRVADLDRDRPEFETFVRNLEVQREPLSTVPPSNEYANWIVRIGELLSFAFLGWFWYQRRRARRFEPARPNT